MTDIIMPETFADFKTYARSLLNDFTQARVGSYARNPAVQEIIVTWGAQAYAGTAREYMSPENITAVPAAPRPDPVHLYDARDVISLLERFMESAGFRAGPIGTRISAMPPGVFDVNVDGNPGLVTTIDSLAIRLNGDLAQTLATLRGLDDETLDRACREALRRADIEIAPG